MKIIKAVIVMAVVFGLAACAKEKKEGSIKDLSAVETMPYELGSYEIDIPTQWEKDENFFFMETTTVDRFAMLQIATELLDELEVNETVMKEFVEGFVTVMDKHKVTELKSKQFHGIKVMYASIDGVIEGQKVKVGIYLFQDKDPKQSNILALYQGRNTKYDYIKDVDLILNNMREK